MKKGLAILMILGLFGLGSQAQNLKISGLLIDDSTHIPLSGATVSLMLQKDSSEVKSVISDTKGYFELNNLSPDSFIVSITYVDFQQYLSFVTLHNSDRDLGQLSLLKRGSDLAVVTVVSKAPAVIQKGDTTQYSASQYKVNVDATTEDLIKKMPGITVDKSGTVTAQGEQVKNVTVDGKRFFGDDATAAIKNLPAEVVDKIQVFDRLSDQAQFTGFDDGSGQRSINIVTKTGMRTGQFGRVYAGGGTDERYSAGGNVSFFKGDRRLSFIGLFNNVNQQNFGSEDLLGISGGGRGGFRGGGGGFFVGQQSGISRTLAVGVNYGDKWGKKLEVTGSYFFNTAKNNNNQFSNAQYFLVDTATQLYDEGNLSGSENFNNRINMRFEYKLDSANSFIFSPSVSFQNNDGDNSVDGVRYYTLNDLISRTAYSRNSDAKGFNANNNLLYRHSFPKKGRTLSVNLNLGLNKRGSDTYLNSVNEFFNSSFLNDTIQQYTNLDVKGQNYGANISYTEPVGKKGQLQFNYAPNLNKNSSDQEVLQFDNSQHKYSIFDTTLSNRFDNRVTTNTAGINYRIGDKDGFFMIGLSYKNLNLYSEQVFPVATTVDKSFNNLLPNLMWRKKLNARENIRVFYRASTSAPSVNQLQNVIDNNNPLFITTGNPDLKQQYSNMLSVRYTFTNTGKGKSFIANIFMQQASDYLANATYIASSDSLIGNTIILPRGAQLTKPVNVNGYLSLRSFLTYATPIKAIKSNINLNGGFSWSKTPGMVNKVKSISDNFGYSGGVVLSSNVSQYVDFTLSYNASINNVKNTIQPQLNNNYVNQSAGIQVNLLSKTGWFMQNDVSNISYSGMSDGFNQSFWMWNAAVGKKFLKNQAGELKLSVYDLLKQNRSITRTVTDSYVEDVQSAVLTQYFMLTFSYRLRNFGVPPQKNNNMRGMPMHGGGGGFRPF